MSRLPWLLAAAFVAGGASHLAAQAPGDDRPVRFGQGFFSQERFNDSTWRWMGDGLPKDGPLPIEGQIFLRNTRKDMVLEVRGESLVSGLGRGTLITILFNGETLEVFPLEHWKVEKRYEVPASKQAPEEYTELRIQVKGFFIPKEREKNNKDNRRLAFKLRQLIWDVKDAPSHVAAFPAPPVGAAASPEPAVPEPPAVTTSMRGWRILVPIALAALVLAVVLAIRHARHPSNTASPRDGTAT